MTLFHLTGVVNTIKYLSTLVEAGKEIRYSTLEELDLVGTAKELDKDLGKDSIYLIYSSLKHYGLEKTINILLEKCGRELEVDSNE